jgi:hypothetical protein
MVVLWLPFRLVRAIWPRRTVPQPALMCFPHCCCVMVISDQLVCPCSSLGRGQRRQQNKSREAIRLTYKAPAIFEPRISTLVQNQVAPARQKCIALRAHTHKALQRNCLNHLKCVADRSIALRSCRVSTRPHQWQYIQFFRLRLILPKKWNDAKRFLFLNQARQIVAEEFA